MTGYGPNGGEPPPLCEEHSRGLREHGQVLRDQAGRIAVSHALLLEVRQEVRDMHEEVRALGAKLDSALAAFDAGPADSDPPPREPMASLEDYDNEPTFTGREREHTEIVQRASLWRSRERNAARRARQERERANQSALALRVAEDEHKAKMLKVRVGIVVGAIVTLGGVIAAVAQALH